MIQIFSADGPTGRTGRDQSKVVQEVLADLKSDMLSYLRVMGLVHDAQGMKQDLMTSIQIGGTARDLSSTTIWGRRESMAGESVPNP